MTKAVRKRRLNKEKSTTKKKERKIVVISAIVVAVASICLCQLIPSQRRLDNTRFATPVAPDEDDYRVKAFVTWFHEMGGWVSPNVQLGSFPGYGYGLLAVGQNSEDVIKRGDQLLIAPETIQVSAESAKSRFRQLEPKQEVAISDTISRYYHSSLERQDVMIALSLMLDCSLGSASVLHPYISILPRSVPRLDTFGDAQLQLLQDVSLSRLARQSKMLLQTVFDRIETDVRDLFNTAAKQAHTVPDDSCLSFSSFHHFVAIVSSHAMILENTKYLVPMADMINHAARPQDVGETPFSFASHHVRNTENKSISVLADRFVKAKHQIFEEYGKLDNSLYLLAHGFVPDSNPHHCVILPRTHLPLVSHPMLLDALKSLGILSDNRLLDSVCILRDGTVVDDPDNMVAAYLAVSNLEQDNPKQLEQCINTMQTKKHETIRTECIEYPYHQAAVSQVIRESANAVLAGAETTLEEDLALLKECTERNEHVQTLLALQFRIADKQVLRDVASRRDSSNVSL